MAIRGREHPGAKSVNWQKSVFPGALGGGLRSARPVRGGMDPGAAIGGRRLSAPTDDEGGRIFRSSTPPRGLHRNDLWVDDAGHLWFQFWPEGLDTGAPGWWARAYSSQTYPTHPANTSGDGDSVSLPRTNPNGVSLGTYGEAVDGYSLAVFGQSSASDSILIGPFQKIDSSSSNAIRLGAYGSVENSESSVWLGVAGNVKGSMYSVVLGTAHHVEDSYQSVSIGYANFLDDANQGIIVGGGNLVSSSQAINMGQWANVYGSDYAVSVGPSGWVQGSPGSVRVGNSNQAWESPRAVSIGQTTFITSSESAVGVGSGGVAQNSDYSVLVGTGNQVHDAPRSVVLGYRAATISSPLSIVIGGISAEDTMDVQESRNSPRSIIIGFDSALYPYEMGRENARIVAKSLDVKRSSEGAAEVEETDMSTTLVLRDEDDSPWRIGVTTSGILTIAPA